jgi:hypothetical protein
MQVVKKHPRIESVRNEALLLHEKIYKILFYEWDEFNNIDFSKRNYESLACTVFMSMAFCEGKRVLIQELYSMETHHLYIRGNLRRCERIAERIFQLEARLFSEKCSYREREIAMDAVLYR